MNHVILIPGLLISSFAIAFAQVNPDSLQLAAWENLNRANQGRWTIRWDQETGTPATMYGTAPVVYDKSLATVDVAFQFIRDNRAVFKMKNSLQDLVLSRLISDSGMWHADFLQTYQGIPVFRGEISVAIDSDGGVWFAGGKYFPGVETTTTPSITREQAISSAAGYFQIEALEVELHSSNLVIVPDTVSYLAYLLSLNQWQVLVNATTGAVEQYGDLAIPVTGNVYPIDPVNSPLTTVNILRLNDPGTKLEGTYAKVTNFHLGDLVIGVDPDLPSNFEFQPPNYEEHDNSHFDDVNVYYHIDQFAHEYWYSDLGYNSLGQIKATVHAMDSPCSPAFEDNALFCSSSGELYFGHGASIFWDLAKKDDVIYHEYTHAISWDIGLRPPSFGQEETKAMHEGYSDYHAATWTADPSIAERVTKCTDTGDLRSVDNSKTFFNYDNFDSVQYAFCDDDGTYRNPIGSVHADGMIWGGALWDLRDAVGAGIANSLVYKGLVFVHGSSTTFLDGREGILIADQKYYGSQHKNTIMDVFAARGIGDPAPPPPKAQRVAMTVHGSVSGFVTAANFPNPFNATTTINYYLPEVFDVELVVLDLLGREVTVLVAETQERGGKSVTWDARDSHGNPVSSGMYLYRLDVTSRESEQEFHMTRKMVLLR